MIPKKRDAAMKRVRELDGLRVFAVLAVIAVHYRPPFRPSLDFLSVGWAGVDLFFVISGYLITTILFSLRGTPRPYRVFYWRRMLRIFPPYYLVLFILTVYLAIRNVGQNVDWHVGSWLFLDSFRNLKAYHDSILLALHGHFDKQQLPLGNYVFTNYKDGFSIFWSLSVEEIFYLIWTPIVLICSRRTLLTISLLAIGVCPLLRVLCHGSQWEFFFFPCRFDSLMMGSLLSLIFIAANQGEILRSALIRGLGAAGVLSLLCLVPLSIHDGLLRRMELRSALSFTAFGYSLLGVVFASVVGLCVIFGESAKWWCRFLRMKPMVYIGTVSYMMYMIHISVWVTVYKIFSRLEGPRMIPGLLIGFLSTVGTIGVAAISWKFLETPMLAFKNYSFPIPKRALQREGELLHPIDRVRRIFIRQQRQSYER
jgi:peptidoglycan/LPS O-acetylase OafA/YrhL